MTSLPPEPEPVDERFPLRLTATERRQADFLARTLQISVNAALRMLVRKGWHHIHACPSGRGPDAASDVTAPPRGDITPPARSDITPGQMTVDDPEAAYE